jgi:hypothetical protein
MAFCRVCKICVHRYKCECAEYVVKNTLCKHVHLICMHEKGKGTNSVLDEVSITNNQINEFHKEEIEQFIVEGKKKAIPNSN